jgi:hypothetical protein
MRARRPNGTGLSPDAMNRLEHLWCETETHRDQISRTLAMEFGVEMPPRKITEFASRRGWGRPPAMRYGSLNRLSAQATFEAVALRAVTETRAERNGPDRVRITDRRFPVPAQGYRIGVTDER